MRFLADMGVSMTTVRALREAGEVIHLREASLHTLPDDEILHKARQEQRVVLTFDLDFGDLLAAGGNATPSIVLFRLRNQTPASLLPNFFVYWRLPVPPCRRERSLLSKTMAIE